MSQQQPVQYIAGITERYERLGYAPYRWFHAEDEAAFAPLAKPLSEARIGVVTTAGVYALGQVAFHYKDDTSVRAIPKDTPDESLRFSHITQNYLVSAKRDPNCVSPLAALRKLEAEGAIGEVAPEMLSCMGGVYSQRRVREELIPDVAHRLSEQQVDAVLLAPM